MFDALGELGPDWTTDDIAAWVRSYFDYQRVHGPWALVWLEAITLDGQIEAAGTANRRHHARRIGKHLQNLGALPGIDPLYDGLIVLALLDTLCAEALRSPSSEPAVVDAAADAIAAMIRRRVVRSQGSEARGSEAQGSEVRAAVDVDDGAGHVTPRARTAGTP